MQTNQTTQRTDAFGRPVPVLTAEERAAVQSVLKELAAAKNGVKTLDMRKDHHRNFVLGRLGGDDYLDRYFPSTRSLTETARRAHDASGGPKTQTLMEMDDPPTDEWQPIVNITYIGMEPDGVTVTAQGIVSLTGMASAMTSNLTLWDNTTGDQLATLTVPTQYEIATQTISLSALVPTTDPDVNVTAVFTSQFLPEGSQTPQEVSASGPLVGAPVVQSVTVINPNHDQHPTRDYIKVALNRSPQQQPDCDYYYNYGVAGPVPIVGLQVNGSAQLVNGVSVAPDPNFNGSCVLIRRSETGDGATLAFPSDAIPGLCHGAGNGVTWNIGPDWFNGAPWDQNQMIDLDFVLNFSVTVGGTTFIRVTSVPQAVNTPPANIATIAPMQFVWGCVAAGTQVRLADGTLRRIETLRAGERVADGRGGSLRIAEVWKGHEAKPLRRLATTSGAEVLVTEEHAVPTRDGVKLARDLEAGMIVTTARGEEPLLAIELVSYDGAVVNLDLLADDAACLSDMDDDAITAFEAGGIFVGDNRMQGVWTRRARSTRIADPIAKLGHEWRLDVANSARLAAGLPLIERIDD